MSNMHRTLIGKWPVKHYAPTYPVRAEVWRYGVRMPDQEFENFDDAARAASSAVEWNTACYERAWNIETGEEWERKQLLDAGDRLMGF